MTEAATSPGPDSRPARRRNPRRGRKSRRAAFIIAAVAVLGVAVLLVLTALEDTVVFFVSPSDVATDGAPMGRTVRLGGMVADGSIEKEGHVTRFTVTDFRHTVDVTYEGILPDLFREGQGVVTEGRFSDEGHFTADRVLAKHDENYMPPEVADALKDSGAWEAEVDATAKTLAGDGS